MLRGLEELEHQTKVIWRRETWTMNLNEGKCPVIPDSCSHTLGWTLLIKMMWKNQNSVTLLAGMSSTTMTVPAIWLFLNHTIYNSCDRTIRLLGIKLKGLKEGTLLLEIHGHNSIIHKNGSVRCDMSTQWNMMHPGKEWKADIGYWIDGLRHCTGWNKPVTKDRHHKVPITEGCALGEVTEIENGSF